MIGAGAAGPARRRTYVFFHAHPDDEALLTAGTMAALAAAGHRTVLVFATAGEVGLADEAFGTGPGLGAVRRVEAMASARALGCSRVEFMGYGDSGRDPGVGSTPGAEPFCRTPVDRAAARLADLLVDERAHLLTIYDSAGGYGHPDHVQVHRVGARAARLAGTPGVLEATVDRDRLLRGVRMAQRLRLIPAGFDEAALTNGFTPGHAITHRVDVRAYATAKRASLAAHASQAGGGDGVRTLAALLRLPRPVFRLVLGTEWYVRHVEAGR